MVSFYRSADGKHKYVAIFDNPYKVVYFGQLGASDYTIHHDEDRRDAYLKRHIKRENWNDPMSPGSLSRWILWGPTTSLHENIRLYKIRFNMH